MVASIGLSHGRRSLERRAPGRIFTTLAGKGLNGCGKHLFTNAGRRRTVVHAARDRKARPDVATGGDPTAMTMRMVGEAVEPRARTYIYAHKNQGLHKRDKLREQLRHGLQEQCCGSCFAPRAGPRCSGVLWALLAPTARSVQSCSSR